VRMFVRVRHDVRPQTIFPKMIGRKRETPEITIEAVRRLTLPALLERLGQVTRTDVGKTRFAL
jgi:hypothetical protein